MWGPSGLQLTSQPIWVCSFPSLSAATGRDPSGGEEALLVGLEGHQVERPEGGLIMGFPEQTQMTLGSSPVFLRFLNVYMT